MSIEFIDMSPLFNEISDLESNIHYHDLFDKKFDYP